MSMTNNMYSQITQSNDKLLNTSAAQGLTYEDQLALRIAESEQLLRTRRLQWEQQLEIIENVKFIHEQQNNTYCQDIHSLQYPSYQSNMNLNQTWVPQTFISQNHIFNEQTGMVNPLCGRELQGTQFPMNSFDGMNEHQVYQDKQVINDVYCQNSTDDENFIKNLLRLNPMNNQAADAGGVFNQHHYLPAEAPFFKTYPNIRSNQPTFATDGNLLNSQIYEYNCKDQIPKTDDFQTNTQYENLGETENNFEAIIEQNELADAKQQSQLSSQSLHTSEKLTSSLINLPAGMNQLQCPQSAQIESILKIQRNRTFNSESLKNVQLQTISNFSQCPNQTLDGQTKQRHIQTPSGEELKQSSKDISMFEHPEHDLTNASSHRSIQIPTSQELKIEKGPEDKDTQQVDISPSVDNSGKQFRPDSQTEMHSQVEEETTIPTQSPTRDQKDISTVDSVKAFQNADSTYAEDEVAEESDDSCASEVSAQTPKFSRKSKQISKSKLKCKSKTIKKAPKQGGSTTNRNKYYKQFDFFYLRTCFRAMSEYYKTEFQRYHDEYHTKTSSNKKLSRGSPAICSKSLMNTSKQEMDVIMLGFINEMFGEEILSHDSPLSQLQKLQMKNSMIMFAQAHRHSKKDQFVEEMHKEVELKRKELKLSSKNDEIYSDFSLVRDVQYKYSKRAQASFFEKPIENYFFVKYASSKKGMQFLEGKPAARGDEIKRDRLLKDTNALKNEAIGILQDLGAKQGANKGMIQFFLQDLHQQ